MIMFIIVAGFLWALWFSIEGAIESVFEANKWSKGLSAVVCGVGLFLYIWGAATLFDCEGAATEDPESGVIAVVLVCKG